jgi:plastocyanin
MLNRRLSIVFLSFVMIATSLLTVISFPESLRVSADSPPTIILVGFVSAWNIAGVSNPTITVTAGQNVIIALSSGDGVPHKFFVDVDKNGPTPDCPGADVCSNAFPPSTSLTFTVTFAPGTYTYYCSFHPTTMLGNFIVVPGPVIGYGGRGPIRL